MDNSRAHRRQRVIYRHIQRLLTNRAVNYFALLLIVCSIAAIIAGSFVSLRPYRNYFFLINYLSSFIFLIEYLLRIISAPAAPKASKIKTAFGARLKYLFSFYGLVDFVAVLPFVLVWLFKDTESIHIITLAYIFIIFKLIRHSKSFQMIGHVLYTVRGELLTAYTACGIVICFAAIAMYYIERAAQPQVFDNIGDGLWWAVVTFTTVGYGDIYPITPLGKLLSGLISLIGIAMIAIPTAIISSAFIRLMQEKIDKENKDKDAH